jgi:RNA polymerase sigma-70 factor (ECF subfamily)
MSHVDTTGFMSEQDLVRRLKDKSPEAFEELVAHYARRLYSVSMRLLRNPQDAEDAVQETFFNVSQSIDTFREESSLYTWLYRIVTNQALAKLKQQRRRSVVPIEPYLPRFEQGKHADRILDWRQVPDSVLSSQQLSEFFETCIDELPEEFRLAYILKDIEKLPEDEVSKILGVTKSTVKNRVHRARLVIRRRVEEYFLKSVGHGTR